MSSMAQTRKWHVTKWCPCSSTQFTEQLHIPSNAMNGQMGAELAEARLQKGWWSTTQKVGGDKRVRKCFACLRVPQVLRQQKEKAEGRVLAARSRRKEAFVPRVRPQSAACPATDHVV